MNCGELGAVGECLFADKSYSIGNFYICDKIIVCKDCEFRYICTDCRIFIKDNNNIYSQPLHCNYNPYIAKWEGESEYIPVEQSLK